MARHRLVRAAGVAVGALGASVHYRRLAGRRRERVDLYYEDGSMVSLTDHSHAAQALLATAHDLFHGA